MEATAEADEFQTTLKFGVEVPSLKVPVAVNCWLAPALMVADVGLTVMKRSFGEPPLLHALRMKIHTSETAASASWLKFLLMTPPQRKGKTKALCFRGNT
jgi:hypothetical protein